MAVANAPEDWRVPFIYHSIDRACIGHCFSFANYEASSLQFRVRALAGNSIVTTSVDQSDDMSGYHRHRAFPRNDWHKVEDWDVEDPFGADPEVYQRIFEDIRTRIEALATRLRKEQRRRS